MGVQISKTKSTPAHRHGGPPSGYSILPIEIKRLIVDKVAEERDEALEVPSDWSRPTTTMRLVALVSRELAALMMPHLWKIVVLDQPHKRLLYFVTSILPRRADHIRLLGIMESDVFSGQPYRKRLFGILQSDNDRRSRPLAQAIALMPKVTTVFHHTDRLPYDFVYPRPTPSRPVASLSIKRRGRDYALPLELAALGDRLQALTLDGERRSHFASFSERDVTAFLSHFPSLSYLSISVCLWDGNHRSLVRTIASLRHLTFLHFRPMTVDADAFTNGAWKCPLKTLSWRLDPDLPFPSFTTFLSHFSSTLTTLHISAHPNNAYDDSALSGPPFALPHLRTLMLHTKCGSPLLDFFSLCPLHYLEMGECPRISFDTWAAFISSKADTLRRVIWSESSLSAQELGSLRVLCEAYGIDV